MGALPKKKVSKGRRDRRRSHHAARLPNLTLCPSCHKPRLPHHICPHCGNYRGVKVLEIEEEEE
ncbi:MAG: 50S ribosomal protein L32 [Chloroflexi bacterium]|nr:MAG: 50S ribosomal protein L32 [Chloroflexota bacterium]HDN80204.1 50S ribosomal protein L32 [Chloroflexota bacterium]